MKCKICNHDNQEIRKTTGSIITVSCPYCGIYLIAEEADDDISTSTYEAPKISSILKRQHISGIKKYCIFNSLPEGEMDRFISVTKESLLNEFPKDVFKRMELALVNLQKMSGFSGDRIRILDKDKTLFYPEVWDTSSTFFVIQMLKDFGFIESELSLPTEIKITAKGWEKLYEIKNGLSSNKQVFVAMWFNRSMDIASNAILEAITECGYVPKRIDTVEHNNKICDQIVAEIKQSKFLISNFTGHRGGVYYEAGFAHGLGIPVIFTCREDSVDELHFDTRQFNHIVWNNENDLKIKLINRIRATVN